MNFDNILTESTLLLKRIINKLNIDAERYLFQFLDILFKDDSCIEELLNQINDLNNSDIDLFLLGVKKNDMVNVQEYYRLILILDLFRRCSIEKFGYDEKYYHDNIHGDVNFKYIKSILITDELLDDFIYTSDSYFAQSMRNETYERSINTLVNDILVDKNSSIDTIWKNNLINREVIEYEDYNIKQFSFQHDKIELQKDDVDFIKMFHLNSKYELLYKFPDKDLNGKTEIDNSKIKLNDLPKQKIVTDNLSQLHNICIEQIIALQRVKNFLKYIGADSELRIFSFQCSIYRRYYFLFNYKFHLKSNEFRFKFCVKEIKRLENSIENLCRKFRSLILSTHTVARKEIAMSNFLPIHRHLTKTTNRKKSIDNLIPLLYSHTPEQKAFVSDFKMNDELPLSSPSIGNIFMEMWLSSNKYNLENRYQNRMLRIYMDLANNVLNVKQLDLPSPEKGEQSNFFNDFYDTYRKVYQNTDELERELHKL